MSPRILLLVLLTASPGALKKAHADYQAGRLDEVLFDLQGQRFGSDAERKEAAALLGESAQRAWQKKDPLLALQFAQMALRSDPADVKALSVGAQVSYQQKQFDPAEDYGDRWLKAEPHSAEPRLFRAELALAEAEWDHALGLVAPLDPRTLTPVQATRLKAIQRRAKREQSQRSAGLSQLHALEVRLAAAQEEAARRLQTAPEAGPAAATARSKQVVVYGTSWCGFCKQTRAYLKSRGIPFEDKDVEKDPGAAEELAQKAAAQGVHPRGVPVIDVHGTLVLGFNRPKLDALLEEL